jgi:hypothetical protein
MDRLDIDQDQIWILDRFYMGIKEPVAWPLEGERPGEPMAAVLAWLRAGAQDPRCLWWVVERFGTQELVDAIDELRQIEGMLVEPACDWAISWLRRCATDAFGFTDIGPDGTRTWET